MNSASQNFSRPLACAQRLAAHAADAGRFIDKRVLLTGEVAILATANGRFIALDALRLLVRICRRLDIWLPAGLEDLRAELAALCQEIQFTEPVGILSASPEFGCYDAILNIGTIARADLPWSVVNSNGWLARVSSTGACLRPDCAQTNAIGTLAAASLGVSEVFKRLIRLKPERGAYFDALTFSCYDFGTGAEDPGPRLPESIPLPVTLVCGQGAIGNGLTLLFSQMPFRGPLYLLDKQDYGPENLGTCVLLGPDGVGKPKALWNLKAVAKALIEAKEIVADVERVGGAFGSRYPYPAIIVNGLDNIPARHAIQDLWPDVIFDGAIGDFSCQVISSAFSSDFACLKCLFAEPPSPHPDVAASHETGLALDRVRDAESVVTLVDVEAAPSAKRPYLHSHIGKKICSVVSEAMIARIAQAGTRASFAPSVPFVATMSAVMVIAALARRLLEPDSLTPRFVFDILQGPQRGELLRERAHSRCICQARKSAIERVRALRSRTITTDA